RVEEARRAVAALTGATLEDIIFTSGGTEANNLALLGHPDRRLLATAVEHDSVLLVPGVETIPVDARGVIDLAALAAALADDPRPALVAVMGANNETGVIQPVAAAAAIVHAHGGLLHCDAVQAAGKIPVDLATLDADSLAVSAHKLGGPQGVGALVARPGAVPVARTFGGRQEGRRRAGTENVPGLAGFGAAATAARAGLPDMARLAAWRDALEAGARAIMPDVMVLGAGAERLPNTTCLAVPGLAGHLLVMALDLGGIAVAAGAACGAGRTEPSHVPVAMGCVPDVAGAAVRVSLGWTSYRSDIDAFLTAWTKVVARARRIA
ncbi:MAG: iscS, partial [Rhodospirillaceae bacterium]